MKPSELAKEERDWDAKPPRTLSEVLQRFEEWVECTGFVQHGTSYYWELRSFFDDDVKGLPALRHHEALVKMVKELQESIAYCSGSCGGHVPARELLATIEREAEALLSPVQKS